MPIAIDLQSPAAVIIFTTADVITTRQKWSSLQPFFLTDLAALLHQTVLVIVVAVAVAVAAATTVVVVVVAVAAKPG